MKDLKNIIVNDFRNFIHYRILHFVIILSVLLAVSMGFFADVDPLNYIFVSVFILPVIIFSVSLYIEHNEGKLLPLAAKSCHPLIVLSGKVLSALILNMIPLVLYIIILKAIILPNIDVLMFILVFLLASLVHIVIGISLAIISKSNVFLSINYLAYIVVFTVVPFFFTKGLIPSTYQYVMIISPAYLSAVLFDSLMDPFSAYSLLLRTLAIVLQIIYIGVLAYFVIRPYFKAYLLSIK